MTATVTDIGAAALTDIGVLAAGEVPDAGQSASFLVALNNLLDQWKAEELMIATITRFTSTLTPSLASFSVGTGGNINIPRPMFIDRVGYVDNSTSPATEYSLGNLMTDQQYQAIVQKSLTSTLPIAAYYNPTYPLGALVPWPIPTQASLLWVIYYGTPVDEFAAVTDTVALPPGYRRMLVKNLAKELLTSYQRQPLPLVIADAAESKAVVKRSNERTRDMTFPAESLLGASRGLRNYDIRTGP